MFKDSIGILQVLIEFIEGLIITKINFWINLGFNWKKLKFRGVELQFLKVKLLKLGLNCVNTEVLRAIKDLLEEI
jgi:hypothetical protein